MSFYELAFFAALFGFVWVRILTDIDGLLWFAPKYYPRFLASMLGCATCVAGWSALGACLVFGLYWHILPTMLLSMVIAKGLVKFLD